MVASKKTRGQFISRISQCIPYEMYTRQAGHEREHGMFPSRNKNGRDKQDGDRTTLVKTIMVAAVSAETL
jgi:hypothetical protein